MQLNITDLPTKQNSIKLLSKCLCFCQV